MNMFLFLIILIFAGIIPAGHGFFFYFAQQNQLKAISAKVSDQQIIELARQNNGEINAILLAEQTGISLNEAKSKINQLWTSGILKQRWDWSDWQNVHAKYYLQDAQNNYAHISLPKTTNSNLSKIIGKTTDAEVINVAIQNKGILSVSLLCVKLNISVDEAKTKLEELRQKEILVLEVNENGGLIYRLIDIDLVN